MESPETKLCLYEILVWDSGGHEVPCSDLPPRWEPAVRSLVRGQPPCLLQVSKQQVYIHGSIHAETTLSLRAAFSQSETAGVLELGHFCLTWDSCQGQSLFWGSPVASPRLS